MTVDEIRQLWDTYEQAWSDVAPQAREQLLAESLADDCTFANPLAEGQGLEELRAGIEAFQQQSPGATIKTHTLLTHHDQLLAAWTIFDRQETEFLKGDSTARFNAAGRLTQLSGFWAS